MDIPESVVHERLLANRRTRQRFDVPDDRFAWAVALMEPPDKEEKVLRYDGSEPVSAWVARLP